MKTNTKRMAWLSPYGPRSDIGSFTRNLLPHLGGEEAGHGFETHLYVEENGPTYPSPVPRFMLQQMPCMETLLSLYDFPVFNVGNNHENHAVITSLLKKVPGVLIFHDYVYQHYLAFDVFENRRARESYARLMGHFHGLEGLELVQRAGICQPSGALFAPWDSEHVTRYPLYQMMTGLAGAVVVHSDFAREQLQRDYPGPVLQLALPYDQKRHPSLEDIQAWQEATLRASPVRFTCFGHIGRAKLLDRVVQAFSESAWLRQHGHLMLAGHPGDHGYLDEIRAQILAAGLDRQVSIELSVSDLRLAEIKAQTDVFVNLRYPNTEAGSGSLAEQLNTGRPVVVHDSGCYADLPEGAAIKWRRDEGQAALTAGLEAAGQQPTLRVETGAAGLAHVRRIGGERYARELKRFLLDVEPVLGALRRPGEARPSQRQAVAPLRASLDATRQQWRLMDVDAFCCSPEPFMRWEPEAVVRYAQILLGAGDSGGFVAKARARVEVDRIGFYRDVSMLRTMMRSVSQLEQPEGEIAGALPCLQRQVWELALEIRADRLPRLMHVGLCNQKWTERTDLWTRLLRSSVDRHGVFWVFLHSREVKEAVADEASLAGLAKWALALAGGASRVGRLVKRACLLGLLDPHAELVSMFEAERTEDEFDEEDYLARHPDVAQAVRLGQFPSGHQHFLRYGRQEQREFAFADSLLEQTGP